MTSTRNATAPKSRLDGLLWERRLSGAEFGRQIGVSRSQVSLWRNGLIPQDPDMQRRIARHLKVSVKELWPS